MGTKFIFSIRYVFESFISLFYYGEDKCIICGGYSEEDICKKCECTIKIIGINGCVGKGNSTYPCYSLGYYSYGIKQLILNFKFHGEFRAGKILGGYMADYVKNNLKNKFDYITYIPSSRRAIRRRKFNQCELLAGWVSELLNVPSISTLIRVDDGTDQIGLGERQRWNNLREAFEYEGETDILKKNILLIDDVVTTGATTYFAADIIKKSGAGEVFILTVAKSKV